MHRHGARPVVVEHAAVDVPDAHDQSVGLGGLAQPLLFLPACRGDQRAVFPERPVHEVGDVLVWTALLFRVPAGDLLGPEIVLDVRSTFVEKPEIASPGVGIFPGGIGFDAFAFGVRLGDQNHGVAGTYLVALCNEDRVHDGAPWCPHDVIDFQRVDRGDRFTGEDRITGGDIDRDDCARHGRR